jgi:phenylpropionate dioxygenase-like ring-hydroxylating dioxygenase large terminal subunit
MFINFWYGAVASADLTDKPVKRRMLGQDFVLFRDAGGVARCLANTCIHRGGSLGGGKLVEGLVQCPYHGWRFDGEGRCRLIPSLGLEAQIPARARVDSYPTMEKYGVVFAFLGDLPEEERPPLLEIPEWGKEGWRSTLQYFEWDLHYKRSIENGMDTAHNEFVHPTHGFSYQHEDVYKIAPLRLVETDWATGFYSEMFAPPLAEAKMREQSGRSEPAHIRVGTGHHGPANLWTFINPTPVFHIYQYFYETPVHEGRTSLYFITLRNFLLDAEGDERMMSRNQYVTFQDRDVLMSLNPLTSSSATTKEFLLPADRCVGRYRQLLKRWESMGWRIDSDEVERNSRRVAYAIPCPGRRQHKGWVLDPVPLVPASERAETVPDLFSDAIS